MELLKERKLLAEKEKDLSAKNASAMQWSGLLSDENVDMKILVKPEKVITGFKNIAGVDIALFEHIEFERKEYDLFITPLWVDDAIEELKILISMREEIKIIEKGIEITKEELRTTAQRVNLFEKVKIPEAEEAIRLIKIYIGDQMTNAVGRSKIAKRKIEASISEEVFA